MQNDRERVLDRGRKRFNVLKAIYDQSDASEYKPTSFGDIVQATGMSGNSEQEFRQILEYLERKGLIKFQGQTNSVYSDAATSIQILHRGICEVEAAITKPDQAIENFPAQVFNNNFYAPAPIGTLQQGNHNTAETNQYIGARLDEIAALLRSMRGIAESFPQAQRTKALDHLEDIETDLKQPPEKRKKSRMEAALLALVTIATHISGAVTQANKFATQAYELSDKLGIPLPIEQVQPQKPEG